MQPLLAPEGIAIRPNKHLCNQFQTADVKSARRR